MTPMKKVASVLVVDDEPHIVKALKTRLESWGFEVDTAQTGYGALERITLDEYGAVLLDLMMPLMSGMETLKRIRGIDEKLPVIVLTAYESDELVEKAMDLGAFAFLTKPFENDKIKETLEKALISRGLPPPKALSLRSYIKDKYKIENLMRGSTSLIKKVCEIVNKVKDADIAVLIQGESGTGKELIARAIHFNGIRMEKPFICVNCAAIPEPLLESELFGHEKGAFTDAKAMRKGRFEQADKGTLFLDEIAEMSLATQAKVLRVIEEKEFEKVGGSEKISVNVRIISATNKDLSEEVEAGRFRRDLFYRINAFPIHLPPLRERRKDIPVLVEHFLDVLNEKTGKRIERVSPSSMDVLVNSEWKGNIRELENTLERAFVLADSDVLTEEHFPTAVSEVFEATATAEIPQDPGPPRTGNGPQSLNEVEKIAIVDALKHAEGNVSRASKILGIGRPTFYRKAKKHRIDIKTFTFASSPLRGEGGVGGIP